MVHTRSGFQYVYPRVERCFVATPVPPHALQSRNLYMANRGNLCLLRAVPRFSLLKTVFSHKTMSAHALVIVSIGLVALAATLLGFFALAGEGRSTPEPYASVSADSHVVTDQALAANDPELLESAGVSLPAAVRLIAVRKYLAFYVIDRASGGSCYATGDAGKVGHFGSISCPHEGEVSSFPSAEVPIANESAYIGSASGGSKVVDRLVFASGFVADGVTAVGILTDDGRMLLKVSVQDNVFEVADLPAGADSVVPLDSSGREIVAASP